MLYRKDKIMSLCANKSVLHLGYVHQNDYESLINQKAWLHSEIAKVADDIVGLDFLEKQIEEINEKYGYVGHFADVMKLNDLCLNETFDVIVCGEIINCVENPGLMLEGLKRFMKDDSIIIITAPNQYSLSRIIKVLLNETDDKWINPGVVLWHSYGTLSGLIKRCGFKVFFREYYSGYTGNDSLKGIIKRIIPSRLRDGVFFVSTKDGDS